jgi:hypothetical protein
MMMKRIWLVGAVAVAACDDQGGGFTYGEVEVEVLDEQVTLRWDDGLGPANALWIVDAGSGELMWYAWCDDGTGEPPAHGASGENDNNCISSPLVPGEAQGAEVVEDALPLQPGATYDVEASGYRNEVSAEQHLVLRAEFTYGP